MTGSDRPAREFRYVDRDFDAASATVRLRYALDDDPFEERITFLGGGAVDLPARRVEALDRV
ncbi:MAG TPA: hypothetical protein VFZ83_06335, partial [Acidimicrobiia bacterium]|nr:hypothetical protein [Acidimicrobiia bacterium]